MVAVVSKIVGLLLALAVCLTIPATANATLTDSEAATSVRNVTRDEATGNFWTFGQAHGYQGPCPYYTPCWTYWQGGPLYYNVNRTGPDSIWVTVEHRADVYLGPGPTPWGDDWRAHAVKQANGTILVSSQAHVRGVYY